MYNGKLSSQYNICAEYLVEVFKYPGTRDRIPTDASDGYGSTPMIGLYGLVEPYSIARITTTQSGVVGKDGKKKLTSKCYCSLCDYVVQNHPPINNHVRTHLHPSLLCTINGHFQKVPPLFKEVHPHVGVYIVHLGVKKKMRKMSQVHRVVHNIHFLLVPFGQAVGVALSGD